MRMMRVSIEQSMNAHGISGEATAGVDEGVDVDIANQELAWWLNMENVAGLRFSESK
jgi:hypothetical protein